MKLFIIILTFIGFSAVAHAKANYNTEDINLGDGTMVASSDLEAGNMTIETGIIQTNCPHCNTERHTNTSGVGQGIEPPSINGSGSNGTGSGGN